MICVINNNLTVTQRVRRLREKLDQAFRRTTGQRLVCPQEQEAYARLACEVYSGNRDRPEILRRAEFLSRFAGTFPAIRREDELIVGSQKFFRPVWHEYVTPEEFKEFSIYGNHGHIIVDYGRVINVGIPGLRKAIAQMPDGLNRTAFEQTLDAFADAMVQIKDEDPEFLHRAPHTTPISRPDEVAAARKPILKWTPPQG